MTPTPGDVVDEWIYLVRDTDRRVRVLVSGLSIQRNPDRFVPIVALTPLGDDDDLDPL